MSAHWKELVPVDRYTVISKGVLHDSDTQVITLLYQPLLGTEAYSLYMTLLNELSFTEMRSNPITHSTLMNHTQLNLDRILQARKKLEAIGLLKSYIKDTDEAKHYLYEILPPLTAEQFFADDAFNIYLYSKIGKHRYLELKKRFSEPKWEKENYKETTASFQDVFTSVQTSELMIRHNSELQKYVDNRNLDFRQRETGQSPNFDQDFDFEVLINDLKSFIIPKEVMTDSIMQSIRKLAFVYDIKPLEMSSIIQRSFFQNNELTLEGLRKEVQKWYKMEHTNQMPALADRIQPDSQSSMKNAQPQSPEEIMIRTFETISPRNLLEKHAEGGKPSASDLKLIEGIMFDQKLNPGVVNVLIDYILNTNDMKLVSSYVEKIASHWKRKKITTVRDAMSLARNEHSKYQSWGQQKQSKSYPKRRPNVRKDKLPKWMTDKDFEEQQTTVKDDGENTNQKWLEDYLKDL